jgi:arylsulfatase A-like enzyme
MPPLEKSRFTRREAIAAAGVGLLAAKAAFGQSTTRPNILFIMADDLGYADLSCYGRRDYQTPNIDTLARDGMKFLQAYANSSVCSATRTALMTGRYQYRLEIGLEEPLSFPGPNTRNVGLPPEHPTIPSLLKQLGYGTALVGKWHLGYLPDFSPLKSGFDQFWGFRGGGVDYFTHKTGPPHTDSNDLWDGDTKIEETGYLTDLLGQRAVKIITEYARARQPFYVSLCFSAPHWPWEGPEDEEVARNLTALAHYDGGTLKTYAAMVTAMDRQVGNVLATLERLGLAGNTIVVFTSDNGGERFSDTWPFSGRKSELLEGGLRIPLLVRWPGRVAPGSTSNQVAMTMDWLPTFLAAAGGAPDPAYPPDGISLLPALAGAAPQPRRVYWRYRFNAQRAVREGDMKWLKIRDNTFLFNVVEDPLERANLKNRQPEIFRRLEAAYAEWEQTMLPENPRANSAGNGPATNADRPGNTPLGAGQPQPAKPKPAKPKP